VKHGDKTIGKEKERWLKEKVKDKGSDSALGEKARTSSGIEVNLLYTPEDIKGVDYLNELGFPGEYPFTRGVYPTMYRGRNWTMRQYSGLATAEESNARYKFLLEGGQTGLSVALDLPTQMGIDSDHELAEGEVGVVGVSIDTLKDIELLFEGIPLDKITTSFTINATAAILLAMYIAVGEKQGVPPEKLGGTIQNDILKEYVARGAWIFPLEPSVRLIGDTIEYCMENIPRFNPISISGAHFRGAGANAIQEIAFTFCDAIVYVDSMLKRGIDVDKFAPMLSFWFTTNIDFFEEIAKFRAARRLWANIMKERYGAKNPRSWMLRFGTSILAVSLTAQQPENNIVRVACEAMAAVLAGVQSLFTASYDEAYSIPTEEAAQIALRTQQVLAYETGITRTVDPLAGSYYVEYLTNRLEEEITKLMEKIEDLGGMVEMIQSGYVQREITNMAYEHERNIKSGEKVMVGVNRFVVDEKERELSLYEMDPEVSKKQIARLQRVKAERDNKHVGATLEKLRLVAEGKQNIMPSLIDAVKAYATIGEITDVLRNVFGSFDEPVQI
jgi:methylmalonyl-CoA mutase N-terminal domain/subunit